MATVQVIHISLLCCHVLRPNNCAAVLDRFRSTLKRHLYTDKYKQVWYIIDQQSVHVYFHHSLNGRRASYLNFCAGYMHICKCNDSAAFSQHLLPICTRFLYTSVECVCGTLQINRQIKSNCLTKRMATVQVIHISLLCCHVMRPNNCAAVLDHFRSTLKRHLYNNNCGSSRPLPVHTETSFIQ